MQTSSGALTTAILAGLDGAGIPALAAGARRLSAAYRSGAAPAAPVLGTKADAAAYAAYRMPATAAAVAQALQQTRWSLPGWRPWTLLDFGAGTGAVAWAAAAQLPSVAAMTLVEQSAAAIGIGQAILAAAGNSWLPATTWRSWRLPAPQPATGDPVGQPPAGQRAGQPAVDRFAAEQPAVDEFAAEPRPRPADPLAADPYAADLPAADVATVSYVLGELSDAQQAVIVALAIRTAPVVVLVEPGTPAGHRRILAARERLLAAGYRIAAPCPHHAACPLAVDGDWCHFAARLPRSAVHRQVKGAELGYEDEKFSYVAGVRPELPGDGAPSEPAWPAGRIVRRPQQRKGLVTLEICHQDGSAGPQLIGKSARETYRVARKSYWGDRWDPGAGLP